MSAEARWREEARFFDGVAAGKKESVTRLDPLVVARYRNPGSLHPKEYAFRLLGDLRGKAVLDVGCGEGENCLLLASLGAKVTGIDISPGAIEVARRRAELDQFDIDLVCSPIEAAPLPPRSFDFILCDNVLHHLLEVLGETFEHFRGWLRPGGRIIAIEPVNLSPLVHRVRQLVPIRTEATPGERPLESADIALMRRHVAELRTRTFWLFGRLVRFVLPNGQYEHAPPSRRAAADALALADAAILQRFSSLGAMAVFDGRL